MPEKFTQVYRKAQQLQIGGGHFMALPKVWIPSSLEHFLTSLRECKLMINLRKRSHMN